MRVIPVNVDIALPEDGVMDLFLLQCHSPDPIENGAPGRLPTGVTARRQVFLDRFYQWLQNTYCPANPLRPFFVVIPELTVSQTHFDVLREIAQCGDRPAGVFAGVEFLTREEYSNIILDMPAMPEPHSWTDGVTEVHRVNTALVLLQQSDGELLQFIQPKRIPSDLEAATHFYCQNLLFFRSTNQTQGRRLNFCIQVCSDFTNFENVLEFRRESEAVADGRPIDFTFLLQRNRDQFATQFVNSTGAYFAPSNAMIDTSRGCLVFANTASESDGKSEYWGNSMLLFPWNSRHWRTYGSATYWLHDDQPNNYQAVVLREPGACVYWLRYRPHYLVNPVAGSGQPGPFVDNHALAFRLDEAHFPAEPSFDPILPVTHWLFSEWSQSESEFLDQLEQVPESVLSGCKEAYDVARCSWKEALFSNEKLSRYTLGLYFSGSRDPILSNDAQEPQRWSDAISSSVRRFLTVYALLKSGLPGLGLKPQPRPFAHAVLNEEINLSLIYGDGRSVSSIVAASISAIDNASGLFDKAKHVLILVSPLDSPDSVTLNSFVEENLTRVTDATDFQTLGNDDITTTDEPGEMLPVCDDKIWTCVLNVPSMAALQARIAPLLGMEVA